MSQKKSTNEWREIYDKKNATYPEWLKEAIQEQEGSLNSWLDDERDAGNSTSEGVYLGDGVYM